MADAKDYPYETHLDIHYGPLEVIDVPARVAAITHPGAGIIPTGDA